MEDVRVVLKNGVEQKDLKGSVLITGFQGFGYTGYIATRHLKDRLKADNIGYIVTKSMIDLVLVERDHISLPYSIYMHDRSGDKLLILVNHAIPERSELYHYATALIKWVRETGIRELVLIGGLDRRSREMDPEELRVLTLGGYSREIPAKRLEKDIYIAGPLAMLVALSELNNVPALVVLPYSETSRPDPRAAAIAIELINKLYRLDVEVESLYEDERIIREELEKIERYKRAAVERKRDEIPYM